MSELISRYVCKSIVGGWQTYDRQNECFIGPAFQSTTDLWLWQKHNL